MEERRRADDRNWDTVIAHMAVTNSSLANICLEVKGLKEAKEKQNGRISKLENWRSYMLGALAVIGLLITIVIKH